MKLQTKYFGEIEINNDTVIEFPDGIPGFEQYKQYAIIKNPDEENPLHWLQCMEDGDLTFVVINPFMAKEDYDFYLPDSMIEKLRISDIKDVMVLSFVTIPEEITKMTINLKAPLIINIHSKLGKQLILDDAVYPAKYLVIQEKSKG
ncbi:flagellar assembly protein FliW [Anaerosolibacter sp.]|uniref:flagellar assembly protein FliW n=1 Tax=Anaerosolibacter sp. TaxID=1872527 RepID=UPI0039F10C29